MHYIGSKKSYYIKRFKIETNQTDKTFSFIDPSRGSKFISATNNLYPILKFNYRLKNSDKKQKSINVDEFIDIKGWKSLGNKIPSYLRMSGFTFEFNDEKLLEDVNLEIESLDEDKKTDDLTLF